ncbi:DEAD/DEAH box helicase family protein [Polynucleobacter paneuropaeus]|nr:DEAD/DEAH box helicase family protein [Polynucleobacter paneuropaeus]
MNNSIVYSRAVGYFRSSIFLITGKSIIDFVKRGGAINLICSPSMSEQDIRAIEEGQAGAEESTLKSVTNDIDSLVKNAGQNYAIVVLATLIKMGALKIRIAVRSSGSGIYHEKIGIFYDYENNAVSFKGSSNETLNAWHPEGNFESIEVFCSWKGEREAQRVERHKSDFNNLWSGDVAGINIVELPEALRNNLLSVSEDDIDKIDLSNLEPNKNTKPKKKIDDLLEHQKNAVDLWKKNGYRGIFEHATGSGKTVTALAAINENTATGFPALVLVPSKLLLKQWITELEAEIPDAVWMAAGAGNNGWKKNHALRNFTSGQVVGSKRVVIATMQTASSPEFLSQIQGEENLLLVADEVHQIGSPFNSRAMNIVAGKRLGLSATPQRYGDPLGTEAIFSYFGGVLPPVISLFDAIKAGRLVKYEYFPLIVHLSASEAEQWKEKSQEIKKEIAIASSGEKKIVLSNRAKMLLIERARIAKKSSTKTSLAIKTISENFRHGESWLVYCEDQSQLREITTGLRSIGISPLEYFSEMDGSSIETLKLFQMQGGVLVSIRCLDEGVDIPSISHALILASSQNPRQFIQRRGRVLRKHPSKTFAKIYDAIVVPTSMEDEPEQFSLLKSELTRAYEFSSNALNLSAGTELSLAAGRLGLDLNDIVDIGYEEDVNEGE